MRANQIELYPLFSITHFKKHYVDIYKGSIYLCNEKKQGIKRIKHVEFI